MPLQLATPQTAVVAVNLSVVVLECAGVDAHGTADGLRLGLEGAFRTVGHRHTEVETAVVVLGGEDEVVLAVFLHHIAVPQLFLRPGHILHVENHTMVGGFALLDVVEGEYMVVLHLEMATVVVETFAAVPVVRGINVQAAVEHLGSGVCHIITWK